MTPCEKAFVEAVRTGLANYDLTKPTSFFRRQSVGSKNAAAVLKHFLAEVDRKTLTAVNLRDALERHESTMGKTLIGSLQSAGATTLSFDMNTNIEKMRNLGGLESFTYPDYA